MKIGIGYDIHALAEGRQMILGGMNIPFHMGTEGHSDADVLIHAVCDALLGALGREDIGAMFPDTDPKYKGVDSKGLLADVMDEVNNAGMKVSNLDCIVIAEEPKIGPYREKMKDTIAGILGVSTDSISIKGKTNEKIGEIGAGKAIAAHAAVLLVQA